MPEVWLGRPLQERRLPRATVINLARRMDRWAGVSHRLSELGLEFSRLDATDGVRDAVPEAVVAKWWTDGEVPWDDSFGRWYDSGMDALVGRDYCLVRLSAGERACALSHVRAWVSWLASRVNVAAEEDPIADALLVFEDDVVPPENFLEVSSAALKALVPEKPDILYLGWGHWSPWRRRVGEKVGQDGLYCITEAEYPCTTHAYVIWAAGAQKLLSMLPVDAPLDHWMARACSKHVVSSYCIVDVESTIGNRLPGDGSEGSEVWGGIVRQHRADEPDTGSVGIHPSEVLLQHQLLKVNPLMFEAMKHEFPKTLSDLQVVTFAD